MATVNFTDDPVWDAEAYAEAEEQEWQESIESTPICEDCGKHVGEINDYYFDFDGVCYCDSCVRKRMKVI